MRPDMLNKHVTKEHRQVLTSEEAARLAKFVRACGSQSDAAVLLGVTVLTISRTVNRHTAPDRALERDLVRYGIIRGERAALVVGRLAAAASIAARDAASVAAWAARIAASAAASHAAVAAADIAYAAMRDSADLTARDAASSAARDAQNEVLTEMMSEALGLGGDK